MKRQFLALALMAAAFTGCTDDSYDLDNISNDFRIGLNEYLPIASSEVKLKDILNEFKTDYISEDSDGQLIFKFDTVNRVMVKPIDVSFKEASFDLDLSQLAGGKVIGGVIPENTKFQFEAPVSLVVDDEGGKGKIDEIFVKDGKLSFHIESEAFDASELLYISNLNVPGVADNADFLAKDGYSRITLDDQLLQFPNNELVVIGEIAVLPGKEIKLTGDNAKLKVVLDETHLSYHKIKGAFKSSVEQIEYTDFGINLYDDNLDYKLNVVDPKLKITGMTNCGIPLSCSVKSLVGKHKTNKTNYKAPFECIFANVENEAGEFVPESKSYYFKFEHSTVENQEARAFYGEFDKVNGRLDGLFNYLPDSISVKCGIKINANPESGVSYFLLDSTYVDLNIEAEVPLHIGNGSYVTIKDTIDGIDILKDVTDYQNGNFKFDDIELFIEFENELPLEAVVTAKFCKADTAANGDVIITHLEDTELDQTVKIPAAQVGDDGLVSKATPSKKKIVLSDDMVEDIKKINAVDFTYKIKVPKGTVDGVFLTNKNGLSAKVYTHLKANISNKEK